MAGKENVIESLSHPEPPQPQVGKDGDPQLSALTQFLQSNLSKARQVIADLGCGKGVVATILENVTTNHSYEYWAIDLQQSIDELSLPRKVHNNSTKFVTEQFFKETLPKNGKKITLVIIRNVLHELDIHTTANFLTALLHNVSNKCTIYIQDMQKLAKPERGNVGWDRLLLARCLEKIGFDVSDYLLLSHSGVPWFALLCNVKRTKVKLQYDDVVEILANHRLQQLSKIEEVIKVTTEDYEKTEDLIVLHNEFVALTMQLRKVGRLQDSSQFELSLEKINILVKEPMPNLFQYAVATTEKVWQKCGLIAMVSNKHLLNFPKLIASAQKSIFFGGYSNRHLFSKKENKKPLLEAVKSGVDVRILIIDPESQAATLRSEEPLYKKPSSFIESITESIDAGQVFYNELVNKLGADAAKRHFKFSMSKRIPRWSYFFVDDTCYLSLYSINMSGSSAPCFVFRSVQGVANNYFHLVRNEFIDLFSESTSLI